MIQQEWARPSAAMTQPGRGHSVLVVDDNEEMRESLAHMLGLLGFEVSCAENGQKAMSRLGREPHPSIILLDMMMPGMNGWEVMHQIHDHPRLRRIPIVVLSAVADMEGLEEEGPVVFLQKPVDPQTLLHVIEHYCAPHDDPAASSEDRELAAVA